MTQELGPNQTKWLEALESGEYQQGTEILCRITDQGNKYCCLGVACELFATELVSILNCENPSKYGIVEVKGWGEYITTAPISVINALALKNGIGAPRVSESEIPALTIMNDVFGMSFKEIASEIRKSPSAWFREPK